MLNALCRWYVTKSGIQSPSVHSIIFYFLFYSADMNILRDIFNDDLKTFVTSSTEQIYDRTPLSKETAASIYAFLHNDSAEI